MSLFHIASAVVADNVLIHVVGEAFHPVFAVLATALAVTYGLTASYGVAVIVVTVVIMVLLMPMTLASSRSMVAMQRLQPEIARLRREYHGSEHRERLNQELMRLYKEEGINPAGSCLPQLLQIPVVLVLYDVIRGLNNTLRIMVRGHPVTVARPRYIPTSSRMYQSLVAGHGAMNWLGINLALRPFSAHAQWFGILPYLALVLVAVVLNCVALAQMRTRTPAAAQTDQPTQTAQKAQKLLPILCASIYLVVPGAVTLSVIVATVIRIGTQHLLFHNATADPPAAARTGRGP
jgi:YidC/Oxa1 family membrane protein insertase